MGEQFYFLSGGKGSIGEVRFDWTVQVRLDCPGSIGPLDNAALARRPIEPFRAGKVRFFWRERLDSMISEHKSFAYGQGLNPFNDIG